MDRTLKWAADSVKGELAGDLPPDPSTSAFDVSKIETDSRSCVLGSTYVARVGEAADGHDYARAAAENGAKVFIVERPLPDVSAPQIVVPDATEALGLLAKAHLADLRGEGQILVVGITGSAGKTTTKDLTADVLRHFGETVAPILSYNNEVGCPLTVLKANRSTRYLVLEMGSSGPGHLDYLTDIAPLDVAAVLLVGRAHLEGFGDQATLAKAKRELVSGLLPGGIAVLNEDDSLVRDMGGDGRTVFFSAEGRPAQVRAESVETLPSGHSRFKLVTPDYEGQVQLSLLGAHQVSNALASIAICSALGLDTQAVVPLVSAATAQSPHRMSLRSAELGRVPGRQPSGASESERVWVLDDSYNANPDSMKAAFQATKNLVGSLGATRPVLVLGEMLELGEESADIHAEVGRVARDVDPSLVVLVGEGAEAYEGGLGDVATLRAADFEGAVRALAHEMRAGDVVLLKGSNGSGVWRVADQLLKAQDGLGAGGHVPAQVEGEIR